MFPSVYLRPTSSLLPTLTQSYPHVLKRRRHLLWPRTRSHYVLSTRRSSIYNSGSFGCRSPPSSASRPSGIPPPFSQSPYSLRSSDYPSGRSQVSGHSPTRPACNRNLFGYQGQYYGDHYYTEPPEAPSKPNLDDNNDNFFNWSVPADTHNSNEMEHSNTTTEEDQYYIADDEFHTHPSEFQDY